MPGLRSKPKIRWNHACTSAIGTSHHQSGLPCQDASGAETLGPEQEILLLALSDGAGSAAHADKGAKIVVRQWLDTFRVLLDQNPDPARLLAEFEREEMIGLLRSIREEVVSEARELGTEPSELSATLLGAVLTPTHTLVAQVGDGAWVAQVNGVLGEGILGCLTWPTSGEFAGQTTFATSFAAEDALQMVHLKTAPTLLAGFTDGLERLLLEFRTQLPAAGFFLPAGKALAAGEQEFREQLQDFLSSEQVCSRTDDDKSIALVTHSHANF